MTEKELLIELKKYIDEHFKTHEKKTYTSEEVLSSVDYVFTGFMQIHGFEQP